MFYNTSRQCKNQGTLTGSYKPVFYPYAFLADFEKGGACQMISGCVDPAGCHGALVSKLHPSVPAGLMRLQKSPQAFPKALPAWGVGFLTPWEPAQVSAVPDQSRQDLLCARLLHREGHEWGREGGGLYPSWQSILLCHRLGRWDHRAQEKMTCSLPAFPFFPEECSPDSAQCSLEAPALPQWGGWPKQAPSLCSCLVVEFVEPPTEELCGLSVGL